MKNVIGIMMLLSLAGCAQEKYDTKDEVIVATEFQGYLSNFLSAGRSYGFDYSDSEVSIQFIETFGKGDGRIGECELSSKGSKVFILRSFWNRPSTTSWDREVLVFHELGHCVLNRVSHTDPLVWTVTIPSIQLPVSIMNPYHIGGTNYQKNRATYLRELFTRYTGGVYVY